MNRNLALIEIQAAQGDAPQSVNVSGVAYSGSDILQMFGRVVIDLAGMEFPRQIPLMNSHDNSLESKLGEVEAYVNDNKLFVKGAITAQNELASSVVDEGKRSKWQLSIGATILERQFIKADEKAKVNCIEFTGPLWIAKRTRLREVSVVAIGADCDTEMEIAASLDMAASLVTNPEQKENIQMDTQVKNSAVQAASSAVEPSAPVAASGLGAEDIQAAAKTASENAVKMERQRIAEITAICNGEFADIQAKAIADGLSADQVRKEVLDAIRAARPATGPNINTGVKAIDKAEMEVALCLKAGVSEQLLAKSYDERTIDAATSMSDISLKEVMHECIRLSGGTPTSRVGLSNDDIRAAFSTVSLPGILGNVANKVMLKSYEAVSPVALRLCSIGSLSDFKENDRYRMTDMGDLEMVGPDGEIKDGGVSEEGAKNKLDTYGKKFCLTRQMIINDDLGAFAKVPAMMGARAAKLLDKLFFARLQANPTQTDGNALFSEAHRNFISSGALDAAGLKAAITLFEGQVDADGEPVAVAPRKLLVPSALKFTAKELLHSALLVAKGSTDAVLPNANVLSEEDLEIVSSPYLTSNANWWLFANPAECDTFEIGFLKGKRTPTVEQGETDFNTLGMWFRVYFDVGVREQDFRGMVQSNG